MLRIGNAVALALLAIAQAADVASTFYGYGRGNLEANHLVAQLGPFEFVAIKVAALATVALVLALPPIKPVRNEMRWLVVVGALVTLAVAAHNVAIAIT